MADNIRILTMPELKALLAQIPQPEWRLMILVAFYHGLRVSEVINLRGKDIQHGRVVAKRLKGSDTTVQEYMEHPDPDLDESMGLRELAKIAAPNQRLFPLTRSGVAKLMKRAGARAGIDPLKLHPHVLKHTCAMVGIESMKINELQRYLGHKSLSSTGKYTKVSDEIAVSAFAKAIKKSYRKNNTIHLAGTTRRKIRKSQTTSEESEVA
jgi:integrase